MSWTCAAEPDHGIAAGILALFDEVNARRRRHALYDNLVNAPGSFRNRETERPGHRRDGTLRCSDIEGHASAEEKAGIVVSQDEVRVRDGRLRAPHSVAG